MLKNNDYDDGYHAGYNQEPFNGSASQQWIEGFYDGAQKHHLENHND